VVTFSQAQQTLVSDLLDEARRTQPAIEPHFSGTDEPVFVKNLENVQGDERDEILFSIGYGPDEQGKLWMQFGPILREGGERRLNVAVTRARQKLRVFSTLTHDQIDTARARGKGARHLKEFLRYVAERGSDRPTRAGPGGDFDSEFERQVHDALTASGWRVESQVGCGGYRIDLAVLHPERPGEYLLGVECDGAPYHSAANARDRDRLRQEVLEGLGWRMHRIWSTDWWFDRDGEMTRLEAALQTALAAPQAVPEVRPPPPPTAEPTVAVLAASPPAKILAYRRANLPVYSTDPEDLFRPTHLPVLRSAIAIVLSQEAPLHLEELARRVGDAFSAGAITKRVIKRVLAIGNPPLRGDFCWAPGTDPAGWTTFRGPEADGTTREAEKIPVEEVAAAMAFQLGRSLSMVEADLARETARLFGITRLGRRVAEAMTAALTLLIAQGAARREGDRVVAGARG
jgi:very-short-patch-repair endonuclease